MCRQEPETDERLCSAQFLQFLQPQTSLSKVTPPRHISSPELIVKLHDLVWNAESLAHIDTKYQAKQLTS